MTASPLRALFVEPLAERVRGWLVCGKLDDDEVDRALSTQARAWVEGACEATLATPLEDVETLVALVAEQLGGETALSDLAGEIVAEWVARGPIEGLLRAALPLADAAGFVVSQASEWLVVAPDWSYTGGREAFELRIRGLSDASPALRALLGALLARLAAAGSKRALDVRVRGLDEAELVIAGRVVASRLADPADESRLHRAALVG